MKNEEEVKVEAWMVVK